MNSSPTRYRQVRPRSFDLLPSVHSTISVLICILQCSCRPTYASGCGNEARERIKGELRAYSPCMRNYRCSNCQKHDLQPAYMMMLSTELVNEASQPHVRNAAGLALKNAISAKVDFFFVCHWPRLSALSFVGCDQATRILRSLASTGRKRTKPNQGTGPSCTCIAEFASWPSCGAVCGRDRRS